MKKNKGFIQKIALERMYRLMDLAIREWKKKPERSLDYLKLMKKIGMRNKVKIPQELKELYCKKCFSLLVEGKDKETRVKKKKLLIKCRNCGKIKEIKIKEKKENFVLGITGNIGSGKSEVMKILERKGFSVFDADKIAKKEMDKVKEELKENFGKEIVSKQGIEFRKLAKIVFNDRKKLIELNEMIHPLVRKKLEQEIRGREFIGLEIPLLFESGMENLCDKVLVVYCRKEKIIERKEKQGMRKEEIEKRMQNQMKAKDKKKKADFVVENNSTLKELEQKINKLIEEILEEAK